MLDSETKRRIDSARDTLVGKVPDPKSQVEQITIALIYKFMDDMDAEAEELGGQRGYFAGDYARFGWAKLLSPALSGFEMLALYSEAIESMTRNPGVPQLFRDIFKNAYLPYRDPETLKMFLKIINDFNYDHSEKLGDAGQFRTPRHIIDFMVKVLDPQKDETILDPACGTAGFLISAYKHVLANNSGPSPLPSPPLNATELRRVRGRELKPEERKKLANNIRGYDISPDMVRLSLANLYLHGFTTPNIFEYDTLSSEERWNDTADVILANPPFMSPKGGIKPHKRFSVQSNRSEVLFVDYMAEHLNINGRAAIIVPEGIIFQSAGAYKQLRSYLIEHNYLWAVVSLPAGMFNPYAGVKTSILLLDRALAKKTDQILFVKIEKDGYDLGAQRRPLCNEMGDKPELCPKHSDLPDALNVLRGWHDAILTGATAPDLPDNALAVSISKLAENGDYNLSADRYREVIRTGKQTWPMVKLGEICRSFKNGANFSKEQVGKGVKFVNIKDVFKGKSYVEIDSLDRIDISEKEIEKVKLDDNDIVFVRSSVKYEGVGYPSLIKTGGETIVFCGFIIKCSPIQDMVIPEYLLEILRDEKSRKDVIQLSNKANITNISQDNLKMVRIPLPPLETQRQIVEEVAAHQRIIDGARQVVDGWKPDLELELIQTLPDGVDEWEKAKIGDICDFIDYRGKTPNKSENGVRLITAKNVKMGALFDEPREYIADYESWMTRGIPKKGDVLFTTEGPLGNVAIIDIDDEKFAVGQRIITLQSKDGIILPIYLANVLMSKSIQLEIEKLSTGSTVKGILARYFREIEIPLPPLDVQREIVARIEAERAIVEGNRRLIELYEEKIRKVIEKVWQG